MTTDGVAGVGSGTAGAFEAATLARPLGDGTFTTALPADFAIGARPHDGYLLGLLARTATAAVRDAVEVPGDPVTVSAQFLRGAGVGPALLRADVLEAGRRGAVVAISLEQRGRRCVEATVITGRLPHKGAVWTDLPVMSAEPPANAVAVAGEGLAGQVRLPLAADCDVRVDPSMTALASRPRARETTGPLLRLWVRPRPITVDPVFVLLVGDVCPRAPRGIRHPGWAPAAQLTSFLRAQATQGWLRVYVESRSVDGMWFDTDTTVVDSGGRLVGQFRKLAATPT